jgi:hypothetical protein
VNSPLLYQKCTTDDKSKITDVIHTIYEAVKHLPKPVRRVCIVRSPVLRTVGYITNLGLGPNRSVHGLVSLPLLFYNLRSGGHGE